MRTLFGTDGIRGRANIYPMTPEVALKVGKVVGLLFSNSNSSKGKVVIGKDTRLSCYMFEAALVAGICSMGADAYLLGPMPTPGISFITKNMRADAGIVISASHNPYWDNGIKIFTSEGLKLDDNLEKRMEELILKGNIEGSPDKIGKAYRIEDAVGRYVVHLKQSFPEGRTLDGLKIVVDCANGATYKVAPMVFGELGADMVKINCEPNGVNINRDCGSTHPEGMVAKVLSEKAHIGLAFDGDGDRVIISDEKGNIIDGDDILAICAVELKREGQLPSNTVVSTIMAGKGLEISLNREGIRLVRTKVGDRFVYEKMLEVGSYLGGEPSGHIIFRRFSETGDGIISALQVLWVMIKYGKPLSDILKERSVRFPKVERSLRVKEKIPFEDTPFASAVIKAEEMSDKINGRVLVRYSGTEMKLRILVEGEDMALVEEIASYIEESARKYLSLEGKP